MSKAAITQRVVSSNRLLLCPECDTYGHYIRKSSSRLEKHLHRRPSVRHWELEESKPWTFAKNCKVLSARLLDHRLMLVISLIVTPGQHT
jgi:hypothetical protein